MNTPELTQRIELLSQKLKELLNQDIADLDTLSSTLLNEKNALKSRDSHLIKELSQKKSSLINQIENRARVKANLIANSGVGIEAGKVREGIASFGDSSLTTLWDDSLTRLDECKGLNQINGLIINRSLKRTETIMNIVRGQSQKPKLYGQRGAEKAYASAQTIAKA